MINNKNDVKMLAKVVKEDYINNLYKLMMKVSISNHVEYSEIYFKFYDILKIKHVSDDIIISMLDNIENRILKFDGNYNYIIIRRLLDNKVAKFMETDKII